MVAGTWRKRHGGLVDVDVRELTTDAATRVTRV